MRGELLLPSIAVAARIRHFSLTIRLHLPVTKSFIRAGASAGAAMGLADARPQAINSTGLTRTPIVQLCVHGRADLAPTDSGLSLSLFSAEEETAHDPT